MPVDRPTFSLVLETVNLALAEMPELFECLESVERQDLDIGLANEVLLVNAGDVPVEVAERIEARFPWLELLQIGRDSSYERAKQAGFEATTGEVVVFFDSDCRYDSAWLSGLVGALRDHGEYGVMGGSTMIRPDGAYGMAVAATFSFDFSTGLGGVHADTNFHWNNVAFRRGVLQGHPIPDDLPLHRTPPKYYADLLLAAGVRIGRQPASRALHAPPRGSTFISRYLIFGHDAVVQKRLRSAVDTGGAERRPIHGAAGLAGSRIRQTIAVLDHLLRERPRRWLQLPAAVAIIIAGYGLMAGGYVATLVAPNWFRRMLPSGVVGRTGLGGVIRDTA